MGDATRCQSENLSRMIAMVSRNPEAVRLTETLWEYLNFKLYFTLRRNDGKPNRIRTIGLDTHGQGNLGFCISVRSDERQEEAFVHELLHAYLVLEGYPKFSLGDVFPDQRRLAFGAINYAEHFRMKQVYRVLGYDPALFLSQPLLCRPLEDEDDEEALTYLDGVKSNLLTSSGYFKKVSAWLQQQHIEAIPVFVTEKGKRRWPLF